MKTEHILVIRFSAMATSPMAENLITRICSRAGRQKKSGRKFLPARVRGEKLKN